MLFLWSGTDKANHRCRCEVSMAVPDPYSPPLHLCWPQTKHMPNGALCVCLCVCVSHKFLYVSRFVYRTLTSRDTHAGHLQTDTGQLFQQHWIRQAHINRHTRIHKLGLRAWHGVQEISVWCTGSPQKPLKTITALTGLVRTQLVLIDWTIELNWTEFNWGELNSTELS